MYDLMGYILDMRYQMRWRVNASSPTIVYRRGWFSDGESLLAEIVPSADIIHSSIFQALQLSHKGAQGTKKSIGSVMKVIKSSPYLCTSTYH